MKRDYETATGKQGVTMFVGKEIENTPMKGQNTLFVVGTEYSAAEIISSATQHQCNHIYLGANMSFVIDPLNETSFIDWHLLITKLLDADFWVTLDFETKYTEWVLEECYTEYRRFIPMISVRIPHVDQLGYNACIKIDDVDFDTTNDGVWVHSLHTLKDRSCFTAWDQYTQDKIIK